QAALERQGVPVPEYIWQHLSTLQWAHIHLNGSYHFTDITLNADFRPLREYLGLRLHRPAESSISEGVDAETIPATEGEELLDPIQLSLFLVEEESEL